MAHKIIEYCPICLTECELNNVLKMFYCSHCDMLWNDEQIIATTTQPIRKKSEIKNEWKEKYGDKEDI